MNNNAESLFNLRNTIFTFPPSSLISNDSKLHEIGYFDEHNNPHPERIHEPIPTPMIAPFDELSESKQDKELSKGLDNPSDTHQITRTFHRKPEASLPWGCNRKFLEKLTVAHAEDGSFLHMKVNLVKTSNDKGSSQVEPAPVPLIDSLETAQAREQRLSNFQSTANRVLGSAVIDNEGDSDDGQHVSLPLGKTIVVQKILLSEISGLPQMPANTSMRGIIEATIVMAVDATGAGNGVPRLVITASEGSQLVDINEVRVCVCILLSFSHCINILYVILCLYVWRFRGTDHVPRILII